MDYTYIYIRICLLFMGCLVVNNTAKAQLFNQDSLKLISSQFSFTEGPAVNRQGEIFFTDQPNNQIWKYGTDGRLSLFMDKAGRANGLYFDRKGNLLACADENNQLWSIDKNGKVKVLFTDLGGKKLNGPNDLWIDSKGGVYFTDPYYQRDYWSRQKPEIEGQKVYYLPHGKGAGIAVAAEDILKPNGIVGTPDGRYLYVADIKANKTYRYVIGKGGALSGRQTIINQGADGITIDSKGNLYLSGKGVFIFNPQGEQIGHIEVNEPWTANLCFGGKNRSDLFITASKSIYTIPMHVKGVE
jgi:gluconolactonase